MKFRLMIPAAALLAAAAAQAAEPAVGVWTHKLDVGINLLQSSYSNNWNGGDKGSVVWSGVIDGALEKQFNESFNWRNTMNLAYGQTHGQDRDSSGILYWKRPDKTTDNIELESLLRWTTNGGWDPFVSAGFKSLFEDLTSDPGRPLTFNPKEFKESAGMSRQLLEKDGQTLLVRLGLALRQNSREYHPNPSPDNATEKVTSTSASAEMITEYMVKALDGRVDWSSKLTLSKPFSYSGKKVFEDDMVADGSVPADIADYTTAVDADFENTFTTHVTQAISVVLSMRWVYDKYDNTVKPVVDEDGALTNGDLVRGAIRKGGQFKQTLALGFGYSF
ncbi:hypothetical protein COW53_05135 [bacterium CG17_big_fil_post_rev_8_21_14_2_50_64_8]|nr:MAG: hypothetical protein COW53_05135 [bacterium CG17_big_fil_post_rev_8_21_14_2_50_64_8]PJA75177.1 MAG: hypothetical protein CO151_07225 [bacterium CG_4_9_14_3_um_filter_65_15]